MSIALSINNQTVTSEEVLPLLDKYRLLPQLAQEIIVDRAIADIDCTPEEKTEAFQKLFAHHHITTDAQVNAWLQQQGMTLEQLEQRLERQLKLEKFKQTTWGNKLEAYFLDRKRHLDRVVYSLIRMTDEGVAQEFYFRLQENESSFTQLAQQYSQGPEAQTGGFIGPVELSTPHPQIAQRLHSSQPGQLSPPIQIGEWWVIIRLEETISAQLDEPMRQRLLDELFQHWMSEQLQQKVSLVYLLA